MTKKRLSTDSSLASRARTWSAARSRTSTPTGKAVGAIGALGVAFITAQTRLLEVLIPCVEVMAWRGGPKMTAVLRSIRSLSDHHKTEGLTGVESSQGEFPLLLAPSCILGKYFWCTIHKTRIFRFRCLFICCERVISSRRYIALAYTYWQDWNFSLYMCTPDAVLEIDRQQQQTRKWL